MSLGAKQRAHDFCTVNSLPTDFFFSTVYNQVNRKWSNCTGFWKCRWRGRTAEYSKNEPKEGTHFLAFSLQLKYNWARIHSTVEVSVIFYLKEVCQLVVLPFSHPFILEMFGAIYSVPGTTLDLEAWQQMQGSPFIRILGLSIETDPYNAVISAKPPGRDMRTVK